MHIRDGSEGIPRRVPQLPLAAAGAADFLLDIPCRVAVAEIGPIMDGSQGAKDRDHGS